ncbi:CC0125/CC1285 family lipoprotein [Alteromonas sp. AMM-1]|uniref:CC0125/CC1285 family lipoprotein n=1 Tax=Alteromonas sp. AMM-1 TaxID=3394233 RepID=UPI0039A4979A
MDITVLHRMFTSTCITRVVFVAMLTLCMLSGCANLSPTPFQPSGPSQPFGYSTHQLNESTFRIAYAANEHTAFDQIEAYAHKRASALAKEQGFSWYRIVSSTTDSLPEEQANAPVPPADFSVVERDVNGKLPESPCVKDDCEIAQTRAQPAVNNSQNDTEQLPTRFYTLVIQGGIGQTAPASAVWVAE